MVFAESPLKDVYRKLVWGPYRELLGRAPAGAELRLNRRLGAVAARLSKGKRAQLVANLRRAFPDRDDLDELAAEAFCTHFADQYISWSFARIARGEGAPYLRIEGQHLLDRALQGGRGAVLLHPHMGVPQLPLCVLGARNYRVNQVGGGGVEGPISAEGARVTALRHRLEQDIPGKIWDGKGFIRPVLRALTQGELVLSAMDGTGGGKELGRRVTREVLGQRMRLPVGALWFALRGAAPILPMVTYKNPGPGPLYVTEIHEELPLRRELPLDDALEHGADLSARWLDLWLREHPGDWHFWDEFEPGRFLEGAPL